MSAVDLDPSDEENNFSKAQNANSFFMFYRFRYESEFYPTLSRVPLHVRMKLDLTGIKISLRDWLSFSFEERTALCHLPVEANEEQQVFVNYLDFLSRKYRAAPVTMTEAMRKALWDDPNEISEPVAEKSRERGRSVTSQEWTRWKSHQRYALYKTAVSKSDPEQFFAVLAEIREKDS
jgi:hypothetical protein